MLNFLDKKPSTPTTCLRALKYKVQTNIDIAQGDLAHISAPDVTSARIGRGNDARDLMQYAIMTHNTNNMLSLHLYFGLSKYASYAERCGGDTLASFQGAMESLKQQQLEQKNGIALTK